MKPRRAMLPAVLMVWVLASGQSAEVWDSWVNPEFDKRAFHKLLIVGISTDPVRNSFEDKFVSHLRGRGYDGMISYRLAPDLNDLPSREKVLAAIANAEVDGVITVRLVPIDKQRSAADWVAAWEASLGEPTTPAELIAETLAGENPKARRYGVEVVLWDTDDLPVQAVWAARSRVVKENELRKSAPTLVDMVMNKLWDADLLRGSGG